jgi:multiple sugar transport system permease protein
MLGFAASALLYVLAQKRLRLHISAYLMILVPIMLALVFVIIPMLTALYLSFTEYHAILPLNAAKWVGLKHYMTSFQWSNSDNVLVSLRRTLLYIGISLPLGISLSLLFAFLLNQDLIGKRLWRFLYFSPLVTSSVAVALIFTQIYAETKSGWLNHLLLKWGVIKNPLLLLRDEKTFLYCVLGLAVWHGLAFTILIFLAGLQQIPSVLYRAAEVDGAGFWGKFWHVSLPGLRPQIIFVAMMGVIGGFQVFEPIYMMGGGSGYVGSKFGPNDAGKTMVPLVFDLGFERFKMGQASAVAYILFAIIFGITVLQLRLLKKYGKGEM